MNPSPSRLIIPVALLLLSTISLVCEEAVDPLLPPELGFIEDIQLPPGPASEIAEYHLKPKPAAPAKAAPAAETPAAAAPAPVSSAPRPSAPPEPEPEPEIVADFSGEPDLVAPEDELFSLFLDGSGWLFTRTISSAGDEEGIDYRGRSRESGGIRFSFASRGRGLYRLIFMQSSASGNPGASSSYLVEVLPEDQFLALVSGTDTPPDDEAEPSAEEEGKEERERAEAMQADLERAKELLFDGRYREAGIALEGDFSALETDSVELWTLRFALSSLTDSENIPPRTEAEMTITLIDRLLSLAALLGGQAELDILHGAYRYFESHSYADRLLFRLASRYESAGPLRDIEAAVRFYGLILKEFPLSPFWDAAERRKIYLERHFLLIR